MGLYKYRLTYRLPNDTRILLFQTHARTRIEAISDLEKKVKQEVELLSCEQKEFDY
jgi:hypothetical protein